MEGNQNGVGTGGAVNFGSSSGGGNTMRTPTAGPVGTAGAANAFGTGMPSVGQGNVMPTATNPFGPTAPITSGTGDVTLQGDKKPKKWWLIGGFLGVIVIAAIAFAVIKLTGGFGAQASDLKSAFNIYANYYLTGEEKNEDLLEPEITIEEEVELEVQENGETVDVEDDEDVIDELDNYFTKYIGGEKEDGDGEYLVKLKAYFDTFYDFYIKNMGKYTFAVDYIDEYKKEFDLLIAYYSGPVLRVDEILDCYSSGGEDAAREYISEISSSYSDVDVEIDDDMTFQETVENYGEAELKQVMWYERVGCLKGGEVDYDCVIEKENEESEAIGESISKYSLAIRSNLNEMESNVASGIFRLKNIVYGEDGEFYEDEVYVKENDSEDEDEGEE